MLPCSHIILLGSLTILFFHIEIFCLSLFYLPACAAILRLDENFEGSSPGIFDLVLSIWTLNGY